MSFDTAFDRLATRARDVHLLRTAADVLGWDREVMMPPRGIDSRAATLDLLARLAHEVATSPGYGDDLAAAESARGEIADDDPRHADVRELRRHFDRATRLPVALVGELATVESHAQHAWQEAREHDAFEGFAPWLERMLALQRAKAACLGHDVGGEPWDALADEFEPGANARDIAGLLEPLAVRQGQLVARFADAPRQPDDGFRRRRASIAAQERLCTAIATELGFDLTRGRIDRSAHPFTSGTVPDDVRITTRYGEDDLFDALYSTIHEVGHGLYEQGLDRTRAGLPTGTAASLGMHESQSRFWENHVGRSAAFWRRVFPTVTKTLGPAVDGATPEDAHRAANRVARSWIRVDADEATYDLHVLVRFRLERALIAGTLTVAELPDRWNAEYRAVLGVDVPDDRRGCLQDVHWSAGLFGYFPTYSIGNLCAAQLAATIATQLGPLDDVITRDGFAPLLEWLRRNVHRHGARYPTAELMHRATGSPLSIEPFLAHLERRLAPVYG